MHWQRDMLRVIRVVLEEALMIVETYETELLQRRLDKKFQHSDAK